MVLKISTVFIWKEAMESADVGMDSGNIGAFPVLYGREGGYGYRGL